MIISADAGRSALKITDENWNKLRVPSVHGITDSDFLKNSIIKKDELITSLPNFNDNQMWIIGRSAIDRLKSDQLMEVNETKEFLKNSTIYILSSLTEMCKKNNDIELLIQLTSNDLKRYGKGIKKALEGEKIIHRYNSFGEKIAEYKYNIIMEDENGKSYVYLQGLCSFFDLLFNEKGKVDEELLREIVLVVDVGHDTTDIVLIKGLSVAATASYPIGSGTIFYNVSDLLRKEGINIAAKDTEWRFIEGRNIIKSRISEFNIEELMKIEASRINQNLVNYSLRMGGEHIDRVILTGGSSPLFYDTFKEAWPHCELLPDGQFSNSRGALKWKMFSEKLS
jgi:hypothetical protein